MTQPVLMRGSVWWMGGCASVRTCDPGNYFNEPLIYARALLYSGGGDGGGGANELKAEWVLYGCWNWSPNGQHFEILIFGMIESNHNYETWTSRHILMCSAICYVAKSYRLKSNNPNHTMLPIT